MVQPIQRGFIPRFVPIDKQLSFQSRVTELFYQVIERLVNAISTAIKWFTKPVSVERQFSSDYTIEQFAPNFEAVLAASVQGRSMDERIEIFCDEFFQLCSQSRFSLIGFIQKNVRVEDKRDFLLHLSWKLHLQDLDASLVFEDPANNLEQLCLQTLAETLSQKKLDLLTSTFSDETWLKAIHFSILHYREGAFLLLQSLKRSSSPLAALAERLKSGFYSKKRFQELVRGGKSSPILITRELEKVARQKANIAWQYYKSRYPQTKATFDELLHLLALFGFEKYLDSERRGSVELLLLPDSELEKLNKRDFCDHSKDREQQLCRFHAHLEAQNNPEKYLEGLNLTTFALPTANKKLEELAWLPSICQGLAALNIEHKSQAVIVFDQSDEATFHLNSLYTKNLSQASGIKILHLAKGEVMRVADKLGVSSLIQTIKEGHWGYGGARNAVYLIAPVIKELYCRHGSLDVISDSECQEIFREKVLKSKAIIFMGDDDTEVPLCNLVENSLLAFENSAQNFSSEAASYGRQNSPSIRSNGAFETNEVTLGWSRHLTRLGMNGCLSKPRFCLNLPYGAEEAQGATLMQLDAVLNQPMVHLASNRSPKHSYPTSAFRIEPKRLKNIELYQFGLHFSQRLNTIESFKEKIYPDLETTFRAIIQESIQKKYKRRFWNIYGWEWKLDPVNQEQYREDLNWFYLSPIYDRAKNGLSTKPVTRPEEKAELEELQDLYTELAFDIKCARALCDSVATNMLQNVKKKSKGTLFSKSLDILLNKGENISSIVKASKKALCKSLGRKIATLPCTQNIYQLMRVAGGGDFFSEVSTLMKRYA